MFSIEYVKNIYKKFEQNWSGHHCSPLFKILKFIFYFFTESPNYIIYIYG